MLRGAAVLLVLLVVGCAPGAPAPTTAPASSASAPAAAKPGLRPVTMVLSWVGYQPHHQAFWIAKERGWYAEQGLDVTLQDSRGYTQVMQYLVAGQTEFGLVGASSLAQAAAKQNVPLTMVAMYQQKENNTLRYFKASGIQAPRDMEGRTAGLVAGSIQELLLPALSKAAGFDASKVEIVHVDIQTSVRSFSSGQFDLTNGAVGAVDDVLFERQGKPVGNFIYADYLPLLGPGVTVPNKLLAEQPELVQGFVKATQRALDYMVKSPREAVTEAVGIIKQNIKEAPEAEALIEASLEAVPSLMLSPSTEGKPPGWSNADDWRQMIALLQQYDQLPRVPTPEELFTNRFVE
jgi:NitT/TauT family transport system substrate-binding protein